MNTSIIEREISLYISAEQVEKLKNTIKEKLLSLGEAKNLLNTKIMIKNKEIDKLEDKRKYFLTEETLLNTKRTAEIEKINELIQTKQAELEKLHEEQKIIIEKLAKERLNEIQISNVDFNHLNFEYENRED